MISPEKVSEITENIKVEMVDAISKVIDNFLRRSALELSAGEAPFIYLDFIVAEHFDHDDEDQIKFNYFNKLGKSKFEIAERLVKLYGEQGWKVEARDSSTKEHECEPVIIFEMKKD